MPNGVSCAYFAVKNYAYGKQNKDVFRDGIAGAQTARTVDTIVKSTKAASPVVKFFGKAANIAKKIVYPLIILSGVYTTAKSDDKLKTGSEQAGGIAVMYSFEQLAEKGLNAAEKYLKKSSFIPHNKVSNTAIYMLKGISFIAASMTGFAAGKRIFGDIVDKIRGKKASSEPVTPPVINNGNVYNDITDFISDNPDTKAESQES